MESHESQSAWAATTTREHKSSLLNDRPFRRFTVCTTGGKGCSVHQPKFAILSQSQLVIVDPRSERVAIVSLSQTDGIEVTQAA